MERLTKSGGFESVKDSLRNELGYSYIYQRLSEYENFLEENGFQNLQDLKNKINSWVNESQVKILAEETIKNYLKSVEFQKTINDLSSYKVMWQKLKQYLNEDITNAEYYFQVMYIMEKIEKASQ